LARVALCLFHPLCRGGILALQISKLLIRCFLIRLNAFELTVQLSLLVVAQLVTIGELRIDVLFLLFQLIDLVLRSLDLRIQIV
jgi:hypothetical protein